MQQLIDRTAIEAPAGSFVVQLETLRPDLHRVETRYAGLAPIVVDELTYSFDDRELARHVAIVITVTLRRHGATVADARRALTAHVDYLIERLKSLPAEERAELVARAEGYRAMFALPQDAGVPVRPAPAAPAAISRGLADLAHLGDGRVLIRASLHRRRYRPLSRPLRRIVADAAASGGTVQRSRAANDRQLRAIAAAGYGELGYCEGRRHKVASLTLNARGHKLAETEVA